MSDEAALLRAIAAHPDEDTPRLAYADWLDEHGNPTNRAAFIRGQIELSRLKDDSLHHFWTLDGGKEKAKLTGVYYQAESNLKPLKVCASRQYRAIAVGDRIVLCYTLEDSPTKVFFRVIHHGTMGPISEIIANKTLDYNLWTEYMQLHIEAHRIWFVNTLETDAAYELKIVDRKR